jgi:hypothetical protein
MIRTAFPIVLAASSLWAADPAPNTLTPQEKSDGWVLLFDGKSMQGWDDPRTKTPPGDAWSVEEDCLKANPHPRITEDLFTSQTYRDFELTFEWKISTAGNSGVKYRIQKHLFIAPNDPAHPVRGFEAVVERSFEAPVLERPDHGQDYVIGFEYQLTDDSKNGDALGNVKHTAGALYDMVAPASHAAKPVGEFNVSRIVVRGNHVEHWMNGVKVVDSSLDAPSAMEGIRRRWANAPHVRDLLADQPVKDCPISLQNHGDAAWFRSIKIRVPPQ